MKGGLAFNGYEAQWQGKYDKDTLPMDRGTLNRIIRLCGWAAALLAGAGAHAGYQEGMDALAVKDYSRANAEFESEPANANAIYQLSRMATQGLGEPRNESRAAALVQRAADLGHAQAKLSLVYLLGNGRGLPKDPARALALLEEMNTAGSLEAQLTLAKVLRFGWWTLARDEARAVKLFEQAAAQNNEEGRYNFALALLDGVGATKDEARGAALIRQGSDNRYVPAQVEYARLLALGRGVPRDEPASVALYRVAADTGDEYAQYGLGMAYLNGRGVARDEAEAARWLDASARQGWAWAQLQMGHLFRTGTGVPRMRAEAFKWYTLASRSSTAVVDSANNRRTELGRDMTPQELADATRRADQFRPVPGIRPRATPLPPLARGDRVTVGDKSLSIPPPKGFTNAWQLVETMQRAYPNDPELRPLLLVVTREDDLNRMKLGIAGASLRSVEISRHVPDDNMVVTPELFADIKRQFRDQVEAGIRNGRFLMQGTVLDEPRQIAIMRSGISEPDRLDAVGLILVKERVLSVSLTGFKFDQKAEAQELLKTVASEVISANKGFFER